MHLQLSVWAGGVIRTPLTIFIIIYRYGKEMKRSKKFQKFGLKAGQNKLFRLRLQAKRKQNVSKLLLIYLNEL